MRSVSGGARGDHAPGPTSVGGDSPTCPFSEVVVCSGLSRKSRFVRWRCGPCLGCRTRATWDALPAQPGPFTLRAGSCPVDHKRRTRAAPGGLGRPAVPPRRRMWAGRLPTWSDRPPNPTPSPWRGAAAPEEESVRGERLSSPGSGGGRTSGIGRGGPIRADVLMDSVEHAARKRGDGSLTAGRR